MTKEAIENATGILQNLSLKTQGAEKIVHHHKNSILIFKKLLSDTSINCENDDQDTLNLMAFTYVFSVIY
jgi:hypothetical protein